MSYKPPIGEEKRDLTSWQDYINTHRAQRALDKSGTHHDFEAFADAHTNGHHNAEEEAQNAAKEDAYHPADHPFEEHRELCHRKHYTGQRAHESWVDLVDAPAAEDLQIK